MRDKIKNQAKEIALLKALIRAYRKADAYRVLEISPFVEKARANLTKWRRGAAK